MVPIEEPPSLQQPEPNSVAMAIFGGDLLVGRSLERGLAVAGYDARFLGGVLTDGLTDSLREIRLVLLAPRIDARRREALLSFMSGAAATARLPVLELVTTSDKVRAEQEEGVGFVMWPCPIEELARRIEVALIGSADPREGRTLGQARA
jgi:hypothetical protein